MSEETEVYVTEFLELKRLAELAHTDVSLRDVLLYNPTKDEEYSISNVEAGIIHFRDDQGPRGGEQVGEELAKGALAHGH